MQNFYIERIELHNYRKFENVEFKLDRNMNLLIGENASGKTNLGWAVMDIVIHLTDSMKNIANYKYHYNDLYVNDL